MAKRLTHSEYITQVGMNTEQEVLQNCRQLSYTPSDDSFDSKTECLLCDRLVLENFEKCLIL